ncbi:Atu4866 domain-containing protein [Streptomyces olivaceus]|uniref:Atu4866 domain-containing protein n=1 Tax=Streptomyces olivaceus TaxID=47716 RepID=UPI0036E8D204
MTGRPTDTDRPRNTDPSTGHDPSTDTDRPTHPDVVGTWVTADGYIRQQLLPNGRYDEARGDRRSAYTGRYTVTGSHLDYVDDTGFTATGDIRDGVLYHEHLVLYREQGPS